MTLKSKNIKELCDLNLGNVWRMIKYAHERAKQPHYYVIIVMLKVLSVLIQFNLIVSSLYVSKYSKTMNIRPETLSSTNARTLKSKNTKELCDLNLGNVWRTIKYAHERVKQPHYCVNIVVLKVKSFECSNLIFLFFLSY